MTNESASKTATSVIPVMRYRDLPAAIDWLSRSFGFEKHRVTVDRNGGVLFAQLTFGTAMIMLGPVRSSAFDKHLKQPDEIGGAETQVCYFVVPNARAHFERAASVGAEIVFNVEDQANGGRSYSCRDPEGHLWNFGTYDPWRRQTNPRLALDQCRSKLSGTVKYGALAIAMLGCAATAVMMPAGLEKTLRDLMNTTTITTASVDHGLILERHEGQHDANATARAAGEGPMMSARSEETAAEQALNEARHQLTRALSDKDEAKQIAVEARRLLARAIDDKQAAEQLAMDLKERLARMWIGKNAAERAAKAARRQLAREQGARKTTERAQLPPQQLPAVPFWQ
jgi:uncharacterized glyoxalase superfamily protein PhnB